MTVSDAAYEAAHNAFVEIGPPGLALHAAVDAVWALGVAEGRRQAAEDIRAGAGGNLPGTLASRGYALVSSYSDRSGIRSVWGPFATEADAKAAATELGDIGLDGLMEIFSLRHLVPLALGAP